MSVLPPHCSAQRFHEALRLFGSIVGETHVVVSDNELIKYADPFAPGPQEPRFAASAAILPASVDEIREVLLQCAIYCGVPAANSAFHWAEEVFAQMDNKS